MFARFIEIETSAIDYEINNQKEAAKEFSRERERDRFSPRTWILSLSLSVLFCCSMKRVRGKNMQRARERVFNKCE
jgi:hypothetical protein